MKRIFNFLISLNIQSIKITIFRELKFYNSFLLKIIIKNIIITNNKKLYKRLLNTIKYYRKYSLG